MLRQMRLAKSRRRQVLFAGEAAAFQVWIFKLLALAYFIQVTSSFHYLAVELRNLFTASSSGEAVADFAGNDAPAVGFVLFCCVAEAVDL